MIYHLLVLNFLPLIVVYNSLPPPNTDNVPQIASILLESWPMPVQVTRVGVDRLAQPEPRATGNIGQGGLSLFEYKVMEEGAFVKHISLLMGMHIVVKVWMGSFI